MIFVKFLGIILVPDKILITQFLFLSLESISLAFLSKQFFILG